MTSDCHILKMFRSGIKKYPSMYAKKYPSMYAKKLAKWEKSTISWSKSNTVFLIFYNFIHTSRTNISLTIDRFKNNIQSLRQGVWLNMKHFLIRLSKRVRPRKDGRLCSNWNFYLLSNFCRFLCLNFCIF